MRVFISHSHQNRQRAERLARAIQQLNVDVWYDEWEILVGHDITDQIYKGIRSSDYMLILLTHSSIESRWVQEEMNFAKMSEIESGKTKIVPLLYEDCDIPDALKRKVYADFRGSFEKGFKQLSRLLVTPEPTLPTLTRTDPDNLPYGVYEIELPLRSHELLVNLLYFGLACFVKPKISQEDYQTNLHEFRRTTELLFSLALRLGVDRRCYAWMDETLSILQNVRVLESWDEQRSVFFDLWSQGVPLYRGGVAQKLALNARVALEIGRKIKRIDNREEWLASLRSMFEELQFSEQFFKLVASKDASVQRITDALVLELRRLHDYRRLRVFHEKLIRREGIWAGFLCIWVFLSLDEPEKGAADFSVGVSSCAEYVLSEISDLEKCKYMLQIALDVKNSLQQGNTSVGDTIFRMYIELADSTITWARTSVAGKAFRLGFLIGILLLLMQDEVTATLLQEIEILASQLGVSEIMMEQLRAVLDEVFYHHERGVNRLFSLVTDMADSFRSENMELDEVLNT